MWALDRASSCPCSRPSHLSIYSHPPTHSCPRRGGAGHMFTCSRQMPSAPQPQAYLRVVNLGGEQEEEDEVHGELDRERLAWMLVDARGWGEDELEGIAPVGV